MKKSIHAARLWDVTALLLSPSVLDLCRNIVVMSIKFLFYIPGIKWVHISTCLAKVRNKREDYPLQYGVLLYLLSFRYVNENNHGVVLLESRNLYLCISFFCLVQGI